MIPSPGLQHSWVRFLWFEYFAQSYFHFQGYILWAIMKDLRDTEDEESKNNTHTQNINNKQTQKRKKEEDFLCYFIFYPFIKSPYQKQRKRVCIVKGNLQFVCWMGTKWVKVLSLNDHSQCVFIVPLLVSEWMNWIELIEKEKKRYINTEKKGKNHFSW